MPIPRNEAYISVRVPQDIKAELEKRAANEGLNLPEYLRKHYYELIHSGTISAGSTQSSGEIVTIPNPGQQSYAAPFPTPAGYYGGPDAMDGLVNDLRKMLSVKMMKDLLKDDRDPYEMARYIANPRAAEQMQKNNGGFDFGEYMKYQMLMSDFDRRKDLAQQQLLLAREKGDKGGEQSAWQTIAALIAAQGNQSQTFMQQFMATAQSNSQQQQAIFTTALQVKNQSDQDVFNQSQQFQGRLDAARQEFWAAQVANMNKLNELTVNQLRMDMERIRTEKSKDTLTQISDLLKMRQDPVYKAAFDAAFGVKDESMIGKLIPQLQAMGIDKAIENVGKFLAGMLMKPKAPIPDVGPPEPIPFALPGQQQPRMIPGPEPFPQTGQPDLSQLRVPPMSGTAPQYPPATQSQMYPPVTQQAHQATPEKKIDEASMGYTNLDTPYKPKEISAEEIIIPAPEPEQTEEQRFAENLTAAPEKPFSQQQLVPEKKKDNEPQA